MRKLLVFAGVAVATYVVALPSVAPAAASDTYSLSACNSWTHDSTTIWDCAARNTFPDFYVGNYSKAFFDLIHKGGKTVTVGIVKDSYSGSHYFDSANFVISSGSSSTFKEYSVTPSQVLILPSRWDYTYLWISGAEQIIGAALLVN